MSNLLREDPKMIVRYRQGTPLYLDADLPAELPRLLEHLREHGSLKELIKRDWRGVIAESTWAQLLDEAIKSVHHMPSGEKERLATIVTVLDDLALGGSPAESWLHVRCLILEKADALSGWAYYFGRGIRRESPVTRESGKYYVMVDGERREIVGARTETEERWDYIADDCTRSYGCIHGLIRLIALVNICREAVSNPQQFPKSLLVVLPENGGPAFLRWRWHLRWPYTPRTINWRPDSNVCDSEWLANDLLAAFAALEGISDENLQPAEWKGPRAEFQKEFERIPRQLEFALETYLRFGSVEEVWFRFRGVTLRWINQTENLQTLLIVPQVHGDNYDPAYDLAMRFLSFLAFETDSRISVITSIGVAIRFAPALRQPKHGGVSLYPEKYPWSEKRPSQRKDLALAFYREGVSSGSVYYSFLSFYKIIQLAFNEDAVRITDWINNNLLKIREPEVKKWESDVKRDSGDVVEYLFKSGRCAIAHTKNEPVADPDDPSDRMRLSKDHYIVKGLARYAIESGLFDGSESAEG